jgi:hypothetical protein
MKTENSNNVVMTVDHANLMSGLRKSFTNKTTVIAELMQNARRAGASYVKFSYTVGDNQMMAQGLSLTRPCCQLPNQVGIAMWQK